MCAFFSLWKYYIDPTPQIYNTIIISVKNKGNPSKSSCQWQTSYNNKHCVQPERPFWNYLIISHHLLREDWLQGSEVLNFWFVPSPLCPGVETCGLPSLLPVLIWQYKPFNFMFSCPFIHNSLSLGKKSIFVPSHFFWGLGSEEWKGLRNNLSLPELLQSCKPPRSAEMLGWLTGTNVARKDTEESSLRHAVLFLQWDSQHRDH